MLSRKVDSRESRGLLGGSVKNENISRCLVHALPCHYTVPRNPNGIPTVKVAGRSYHAHTRCQDMLLAHVPMHHHSTRLESGVLFALQYTTEELK